MVFSNNASNQANNRNDSNSSNQNNKAHKEAIILRWTLTIQYPSDDKTNPAEAGFLLIILSIIHQYNWTCICCRRCQVSHVVRSHSDLACAY